MESGGIPGVSAKNAGIKEKPMRKASQSNEVVKVPDEPGMWKYVFKHVNSSVLIKVVSGRRGLLQTAPKDEASKPMPVEGMPGRWERVNNADQ